MEVLAVVSEGIKKEFDGERKENEREKAKRHRLKEKQEHSEMQDKIIQLEKEIQQLKDRYEDVVQRYEFDSSLWNQKLQVCEEELQKQYLRSQELEFQVQHLERNLRESSAARQWLQSVYADDRLFSKIVGMNKSEFTQLYNDIKSKLSHTTHHSDERTRNSWSTYTDTEELLLTLTTFRQDFLLDFLASFISLSEEEAGNIIKRVLCAVDSLDEIRWLILSSGYVDFLSNTFFV